MDIFSISKNEKSNNKFKLLVCVNLRNVGLMFCEGRMALLSNFFNCNWITVLHDSILINDNRKLMI